MFIQAFPSGPFATNTYLVGCQRTNNAAIIDAAPNSFLAVSEAIILNKLTPTAILITHSHWDHIAEVHRFKTAYSIPVYIHSLDLANLENPGSDRLRCWIEIQGATAEHLIDEETIINIGDIHFTIIHTPGHTPGGVCFYSKEDATLFSGDTLFKGTIGNLSFPTCQPDLMWPSLDKLAKLPPATKVFPGHGPQTTIGAEKWLSHSQELFGH